MNDLNNPARDNILKRLKKSVRATTTVSAWPAPIYNDADRLNLFIDNLGKMGAEVRQTGATPWWEILNQVTRDLNLQTLAYGPSTWFSDDLRKKAANINLIPYAEDQKEEFFFLDAALTTAQGGLAETGALILSPDIHEPRSLSLVPPTHIVLVRARDIHNNLGEALNKLGWPENMPTNLLLIAGPSRTSDIEMTLSIGVHGPKNLVVIILP